MHDETERQRQEYDTEIERLKWELLQEQGKHAKWVQHQDEEGNVYYMNEVTGETRYEGAEKNHDKITHT